jgi:hypothetical protein
MRRVHLIIKSRIVLKHGAADTRLRKGYSQRLNRSMMPFPERQRDARRTMTSVWTYILEHIATFLNGLQFRFLI